MASPKIKEVLVGFEAEFGQDPTTKPYLLYTKENSINASMQTKTDNVIGGDIDSGGELYKTYDEISGSLKTPLTYEQIGLMLKMLMGEPVTEPIKKGGQGADKEDIVAYKHTFKSNVELPSMCVQDTLKMSASKDFVKKFNGVRANSISISAGADSDYDVELGVLGALADDNLINQAMPKMQSQNRITLNSTRAKHGHARLFITKPNGSGGYQAESEYKLSREFSLSVDRGVEAIRLIGGAAMVEDSKFDLTGQLSSVFDEDFYKRAKAGEQIKTRLSFEKDEYNKIDFIIEQTQFAIEDNARSYGGQYPLEMKFNGVKTGATAAKLQVVVINSVSAYKGA